MLSMLWPILWCPCINYVWSSALFNRLNSSTNTRTHTHTHMHTNIHFDWATKRKQHPNNRYRCQMRFSRCYVLCTFLIFDKCSCGWKWCWFPLSYFTVSNPVFRYSLRFRSFSFSLEHNINPPDFLRCCHCRVVFSTSEYTLCTSMDVKNGRMVIETDIQKKKENHERREREKKNF